MADGILKVGTITTSSGSGTITIGQSGETISGLGSNTSFSRRYCYHVSYYSYSYNSFIYINR